MTLAEILLIAVGLAMDAFAVSVTCGLALRGREHLTALRIALSFGAFQAGMPILGWLGGLKLREAIAGFDHWLALALLGYVGGRMIWNALRSKGNALLPSAPDGARLLLLSIATSIDALAVGFTLSLLKVEIVYPAVVIGAVTFAISFSGIVLGYEFKNLLRERLRSGVQVLGGLILIGIGLKILLEHLLG